jgi:hypothetical protein
MRFKQPVRHVRTTSISYDESTGEPVVTRKLMVVNDTLTAISVEREQFKADKNGVVDVPDRLAPRLLTEGWVPVGPSEQPAAGAQSATSGAAQGSGENVGSGAQGGASGGAQSGANRGAGNRGNG